MYGLELSSGYILCEFSLQKTLHSFLKLIPNKTHQQMQFLKRW